MPSPSSSRLLDSVGVWVGRVVTVAVPLFSVGLATWAVVAFYAALRRSRRLGYAAAGYLALDVYFFTALTLDGPDNTGWWTGTGVAALFVGLIAGVLHGVLLAIGSPRPRPGDPDEVALLARLVRREQARQLVYLHPAIARELRIGRPDLPRTFDDGGLVDINTAPELVLASLPGLAPEQARRIVTDRHLNGALTCLDDLVHRNLVARQLLETLSDTLVVVPPL
jgi:hypothetical protein